MKLQDSDSKSKYEGVSDEELIQRLRDGEDEDGITEFLLNRYKNLVKVKARSMFILGADSDDLNQEGMIGLFKAIRDYDFGRDAMFSTFVDLCVSRQMYTAVTASRRKKHTPLNSYVSLSEAREDSESEGKEALESLQPLVDENPESIIIGMENAEEVEHLIESELSTFERQCLELFMTGMTYVQIAKVLGKDEKSTDNALQRAKMKLKKLLKK